MDHSIAYLIDLSNDPFSTAIIESKPEQKPDDQYVYKDESHLLNIEHGQLSTYYNNLGDVILGYESVILFGPTDAKSELLNLLNKNHLFNKIKIEICSTDKMSETERNSFVNNYFLSVKE